MSVNSLLTPRNKEWSNLHINSLQVYNDLDVQGDLITVGETVLENVQIDGVLNLPPGSQVDGDPLFTGEITATGVKFFGAGQLTLNQNVEGSINFTTGGSFIATPQIEQLDFLRVGEFVQCSVSTFNIPSVNQNASGELDLTPPSGLGVYAPKHTFKQPLIFQSNTTGGVGPSSDKMGAIEWDGTKFVLHSSLGSTNFDKDNDDGTGLRYRAYINYRGFTI